jgi:hypothetical protein
VRFYDPEDIPSGRFCITCERFISDEGLVFTSEHRGITIYMDSQRGIVHTLLSEKLSNRQRKKRYPVKPSVETIVYTPALPPPVATPDPSNLPSLPTPANQVNGEHIEPPPPEVVKGSDTGEQPSVPLESTPDDWAMWEPQPDDWFEGRVKTVDNGFMFLTLTNGDDVFVPYDVVVQFPNGHRCVIRPGDVVGTRIEPSNKGNSQWAATEVYFQTQHEVPPEPESGIILWWKDKLGVVIRECACRMFVRSCDAQPLDVGDRVIISQYEDSIDPARPGRIARQIEFVGEPE